MRAVWRDPYNGDTPVKVTDIAGEKNGQSYYIVDGVKGPVPGSRLTFPEEPAVDGTPPLPENRLTNGRPRSNLDVQGGADEGGPGSGNARQPKGDKPRGNNFGDDEQEFIDDIEIIEGKVGGKIPVDEFKKIRQSYIKNPGADAMTFGKYTPTIENGIEDWSKPGPDSYIVRAGNSSYFDLGEEYDRIKNHYNLNNTEMFDYINRLAIDDAIRSRKLLRFSHNPLDYDTGALPEEWNYMKERLRLTDKNLIFKGGFWYVE